jgi:hypothetical protein
VELFSKYTRPNIARRKGYDRTRPPGKVASGGFVLAKCNSIFSTARAMIPSWAAAYSAAWAILSVASTSIPSPVRPNGLNGSLAMAVFSKPSSRRLGEW